MADTTQTRRILIKVDASGASEVTTAAKKLDQLNKSVSDLNGGMKFLTATFKSLAAAFVLNEIRTFIQDIFQTGVELKNMSQAVGVSVEQLSRIKVAAELSGVPMENLTVALRRLNVNIIQASTGNGTIAASFKALGVNVQEAGGKAKPTIDVFLAMANRFKNLADDGAKSALAIKIFGRSGSDIVPLLNLGSDAIQKFNLHIGDEFATNAKEFVNNIQIMKLETRNFAFDTLGPMLPVLNEAIEKFNSFGDTNIEVSNKTKFLQSLVTLLAITVKVVASAFGEAADLIKSVFNDAITVAVGVVKTFIAGIDELVRRLQYLGQGNIAEAFSTSQSSTVDAFKNMYSKINKEGEDFALKAKLRFYDILTYSADLTDKLESGYKSKPGDAKKPSADPTGINKRLAHEQELLDVLKAQGREQAALQDLELRRYGLSNTAYENEKDRYKTQQDIVKATKGFNLKIPAEASLAKQYKEEAQLQEQAREANRNALEEQKHGLEGFKVGATEAFRTYVEAATDAAAQTKQLFTNAFKGMEDGLVEFVKTGKFQWANLANAIIDDIIRIEIRMAIAGLLSSVAGAFASPGPTASAGAGDVKGPVYAAEGGIMSDRGMLPLHNYATGGIANSPQMAIFGEGRMPEAYVPLPNGRSIPVEMSGGGDTQIEVNVHVESGDSNVTSSKEKGKALGGLMVAVIRAELMQQKRPGGLLA